MAFPSTPLDLRTELLLGSTWTDVSSYVLDRDKVVITRGRANEASTTERSTSRLSVDNRSGRFTPQNPIGAYYGQIGLNTPLRHSLPGDGTTYCRVPGRYGQDYASCPDAAGLHVTGDIDIRIDVTLNNVLQYQVLAVKGDWYNGASVAASNLAWILYLQGSGQLKFRWSADGASSADVVSPTVNLSPSQSGTQLAIRVTVQVNNGSGGHVVTWYTAPNISGTWTQLGSTITHSGTTSVFASTAPIQVGEIGTNAYTPNQSIMSGRLNAFQLLSGIGGTVVASPNFSSQAIGTTSFSDAQGNPWTLNGQMEVTNRQYRFYGEVSNWPPKWDVSGKDIWTPIEAAGILRRYGQGTSPVTSPIKRAVTISKTTPIVYWYCEDAPGSTAFAVGAGNGQPMAISGSPTLATDSHVGGSAPLPTISNSVWTGTVPAYTLSSPNAVQVGFVVYLNTSAPNGAVIARVIAGTTRFDFAWNSAVAGFYINAYDASSGSLLGSDNSAFATSAPVGTQCAIAMNLSQSGANIAWGFTMQQPGINSGTGYSNLPSRTLGRIVQVVVGPSGNLTDTVVGHIGVYNSQPLPSPQESALTGGLGETAGNRFVRLCLENGVAVRTVGDPNDSPQMGSQGVDTFINLLKACTDVDSGIMFEPRDVLGLGIYMRSALFSQASSATLSHNGGHLSPPLDPTYDDQLVRNDWTVTRKGGSAVRATLDSGAMSTADPPGGVGRYPSTPTLNLYQDSQLADEATWRLHAQTVNEYRYPAIRVDLAAPALVASPALTLQVQTLDIGQVLTLTGMPSWFQPSDTRQLVQGITEEMGVKQWRLTFNCSPASPYDVLVLDDPVFGILDTDGSTLHDATLGTTATSFGVDTTNPASPLWTPAVTDWPFDVQMDGEQITVIAVGQILNGNPSFEVDASGWTATNATVARSTAQAFRGTASGLVTASGGSVPRAEATAVAVTAGQQYRACGWLYVPVALGASLNVNWYDGTHTYLSTSANDNTTPTAGTWFLMDAVFTAPASAAFAGLVFSLDGTPAGGSLLYGDDLRLIPVSTYTTSPQTFTVVRSVNGVVKTHAAGADIRLARPFYWAL